MQLIDASILSVQYLGFDISNNEEVAEIFNNHFVNVADGIGKDYVFNPQDHPLRKFLRDDSVISIKF